MPESKSAICQDGTKLAVTVYPAQKARGTIVFGSAIGVPRKFYGRFAQYLADNGFNALIFDYRGTGDSAWPENDQPIEIADLGRQDVAAVIRLAQALGEDGNGALPLFYVGHSLGCQMVGLAKDSDVLSGIILVAGSCPNWKRYPFPMNLFMLMVSHFMLPVFSAGRQNFPAKALGLSTMPMPAGIAAGWGRWMRAPDYLFSPRFELETHHHELDVPLLAYGFSDDTYAPQRNIDILLGHYSSCKIDRRVVDVEKLGIGKIEHMGYFREKSQETLWQETLTWLEETL